MERPRLKKSLGQHHLREPGLCRPLIDFLRPRGDDVVEVGPGGGVLTEALLGVGARVTAWELDRAWAFAVARRLPREDLRVVIGDALDLPWDRLPRGCKVAGNLPYNVATPLLDAMLGAGQRIAAIGVLLQLEVAERLVAPPGSKVYGALSVLTQARAVPRILARVLPGSFVPPPKVGSAFVGLAPRQDQPSAERLAELRRLVYAAFGQRRKTLRNALGARWPREQVVAAIEDAGLTADVRAEQVPLAVFLELSDLLR